MPAMLIADACERHFDRKVSGFSEFPLNTGSGGTDCAEYAAQWSPHFRSRHRPRLSRVGREPKSGGLGLTGDRDGMGHCEVCASGFSP
jgi:hypothetical protein